MTEWLDDLFPSDVFSRSHPRYEFWKKRYGFLNNIDLEHVKLMLNVDAPTDNVVLDQHHRAVIFTSCAESPRYTDLINMAHRYPDRKFIWLADLDCYDFPLPSNVEHVPYRHWYIRLEMFHDCFDTTQVPRVKNKVLTHKFSSLSYYMRQARAVVTAALQTHAPDSLVSWHNLDNSDGIQRYYVDTFREHEYFADLDWSWISSVMSVDDYTMSRNTVKGNMFEINNPAYQSAVINFNNETDSMGWLNDGVNCYNRPGPFLTEKTWKSLLSGTVLLNSGQPGTFKFLQQAYRLPLEYNIDISYDDIPQDFDRFKQLVNLIENLSSCRLQDIVDQNIDTCERVQNIVLDPGYLELFRVFNSKQDYLIAEKLA